MLENLCNFNNTHLLSSSSLDVTSIFFNGNHTNEEQLSPQMLRFEIVKLYNSLWLFANDHLCSSVKFERAALASVANDLAADLLDILLYIGPLQTLQQHVTAASSPQGNNVSDISLTKLC